MAGFQRMWPTMLKCGEDSINLSLAEMRNSTISPPLSFCTVSLFGHLLLPLPMMFQGESPLCWSKG